MDASTPSSLPPIAHEIWDMKYRFKRPDGTPVDETVDDTWRRVARTLAAVEAPGERARWQETFFDVMAGYRFLPAGRILAGAGTGRSVTLFNCFVMGTLDDSMPGIFQGLKEAALTLQQGGGIGHDFSTLRPMGAPVAGVGADASGPLSFMDVWDAMCRTIMSAGSRRGAMMATMRCDHPDIEAFVDAKRDPKRLRNFNLSVLVTDAFMAALGTDADWPLVFAGKTFKTVRARDLWDRIMRATYDSAEPGVVFIDRINEANNLGYCETIYSTNPCVTGDTWVMTTQGPRQADRLVGRPFDALVDGQAYASSKEGFFPTGTKAVVHLTTREGYRLRLTPDHLVRKVVRKTRYSLDADWQEAGLLKPGDEILLNDHRGLESWGDADNREEEGEAGYLLGLLIGDGTIKSDKAILSVWPEALAVGQSGSTCANDAMMVRAEAAIRRLGHRSDFSGWRPVAGRREWRLSTAALKELAHGHGLSRGGKTITPAMERRSAAFTAGVLAGLFDTDGSVQGSRAKGISVRLAQSDLAVLEAAQRMLLRLGIASTIYQGRRPAGTTLLPDGRGSQARYAVKAQHELVISGGNIAQFAECIGFTDSGKRVRLQALGAGYVRRPNRERFVAVVENVTPDGVEPVYDVSIPGLHAFDANGLYVHNCGEQPLPPYGACLLGSVNLASLVRAPFEDEASLDLAELDRAVAVAVRMMDNVIEVSNYPLPEQEHEAKAKRRIGLGLTGLADALAMCRLRYGTEAAAAQAQEWMAAVENAAYRASIALARERGPFPLFEADAYLASGHVRSLAEGLRRDIAKHGIRNALVTSIAPTGTISLFAGNVSSGVEPVFAFRYERKVLLPDGSHRIEPVEDLAVSLYRERFGQDAELPDYFVTAQTLAPSDHLRMQAALQRHVDSSISKTINCPASIAFDDFKAVYQEAYDLGLKGCTTYRPNPITGAILSSSDPAAMQTQPALPLEAPVAVPDGSGEVVYMKQPLERETVLPGFTYKLKWPDSDHAIYITINDIMQDGRRRPFEIFINSKNMEHYAWTVALTRMVSAVFRRGGDVSFVVEELKAVFDPRGGHWLDGRYVPSLLAAIGGIIERHMIDIGFITPRARGADAAERLQIALAAGETTRLSQCPKCGEAAIIYQEGCARCLACDYSKCG